MGLKIEGVRAREVVTERGLPGVEATVMVEGGVSGTNVAGGGLSFGKHEAGFFYNGRKRYGRRGVTTAVRVINEIIAPSLKGMDVTEQRKIDETIMNINETETRSRLGSRSTASVSGAVAKAAANSISVPLYRYIGGMDACILPVPTIFAFGGSRRYASGKRIGGKPSYHFICHDFRTLTEVIYAGWNVQNEFRQNFKDIFHILRLRDTLFFNYNLVRARFGFLKFLDFVESFYSSYFRKVESDRVIWEAMASAITNAGYEGRVGILVDAAAGCYYDAEKSKYVGLFSREEKSPEELFDEYAEIVSTYPFMVLEDPLNEEDFEGHALLTKKSKIEVVGDDLFASDIKRLQEGIEMDACNAMLLRVNLVGTISEVEDIVQLAHRSGYRVMPCGTRGEGVDTVDYAVGLATGQMKGGGSSESELATRLLKVEEELGSHARFLGKECLFSKALSRPLQNKDSARITP